MTHSLERLNDKERELLLLLAQGHTAKTIAHSQGLSVNVVNERLRSARRKTDAPSSRNLARLIAEDVRAQRPENRDKLPGIERAPSRTHRIGALDLAAGARIMSRSWRSIVMLGVVVIAALVAYKTGMPDGAHTPVHRGVAENLYSSTRQEEAAPRPSDVDRVSEIGRSVVRTVAAKAGSELTPDQRERFRDPSVAEYRSLCASGDAADEGYCSGVIFSQLGGDGVCAPAAVNSTDPTVSGPALSLLVQQAKARFETVPTRDAEAPTTFVRAALRLAYPCGRI